MSEFLNDIFKISAMCSGVIIILLLVRMILGKKTGAWWRSIVWLLLLVRLCMPISINSSLSIYKPERVDVITNYISPIVHQESDYKNINDTSDIEDSISLDETAMLGDTYSSTNNINLAPIGDDIQTMSQVDDVKRPINWLQLVHYFYVCGLVASLVYLIARMLTLAISLKRYDRCTDDKVLQLFLNVKSNMRIRRKVDILVDKNKSVPALCGVFCPKLILPHSAIECMTEKQLEYVFVHELTHLKRNDVLRLWFVELVLCIHWFNPILYFARPIIRQDMELSCDEKIIMHLQDNSFIDYCNVLMMSSVKKYRPIPGVITANLAGKSGKKLKERLTMIRNFNKKKVIISGILLFITLVVILVACTTQAKKEDMHLSVTPKQMSEKLKIISKAYIERAKKFERSKKENSLLPYNPYLNLELDSEPEKSTNDDGLMVLTYGVSHETVDDNVLSFVYTMDKSNKYIKEIAIVTNEDTKDCNRTGHHVLSDIVVNAFAMIKEDVVEFDIERLNDLLQTGRAYDNTVMYCYEDMDNSHYRIIRPVYDPEIPIYKSKDDSLEITPHEVNQKFIEEVLRATELKTDDGNTKEQFDFLRRVDIDFIPVNSNKNALEYHILKDDKGKIIASIIYELDNSQEYIKKIDLVYDKDLSDDKNRHMFEVLDYRLVCAIVKSKNNFISPSQDYSNLLENKNAFDGTVKSDIIYNDSGCIRTIKHISKNNEEVRINQKRNAKHLDITPEQMNQKIEALTKKYSDLAEEYDKNPTKEENGNWIDNPYVHIELYSQPTKSTDSDGLTEYEYKIRHNKVANEEYEIEEYKVCQEIIENNTTRLVYVMAEDNKYIKEIRFNYQVNTYKENKVGNMFNTIVKQAFVLTMDKDDSLINKISRGYTHPLYRNGRAYDNTVMYCYNNNENKRGGDIVPVYNPELPIYKSRDDSLAITPKALNAYIVEDIEGRIKGFKEASLSKDNSYDYSEAIGEFSNIDTSLIPIKGQDEKGYTTLLYSISKNNEGEDVISLKYTLDKLQEYISRIDLIYNSNKDLTNKVPEDKNNIYNVDYLEDVLFDGMVAYRKNFNSPMGDKLGKYEGLAFDDTVMKENVNEGGISTYTIRHIPKPQNNNNNVSHLGITPQEINNNITYLLENEWLETRLRIDFKNSTKLNEDGKTIIKYSIVKDKDGDDILSLSYTLASDEKHIESIMASNHEFFKRGKNQELYIDLNIIVNKAYSLAVKGEKDLNGKIDPDDKSIYANNLKRDTIEGSVMDSGNNTYTTIIKTSLDIKDALRPIEYKVKKYYSGLSVTPDEINQKIQYLLDTEWISTELVFNKEETHIKDKWLPLITIEYTLKSKQDSSKILNLYYVMNEDNEHVDDIYVIYKRYLGDEKTDALYKDLCMISDRACLLAREKEISEDSKESNHETVSLSEWDYDGRVNVVEATDNDSFIAKIEGRREFHSQRLPLDTVMVHPNLGITPQQMHEKLTELKNYSEFENIKIDIEPLRPRENVYQYVLEKSVADMPIISFFYNLTDDKKYIKTIWVGYIKDRSSHKSSEELRNLYIKLKKMMDVAFVMAKDDIQSYESFSSDNYPFPSPINTNIKNRVPASKMYDGAVYIVADEDVTSVEQWISAARLDTELIYFIEDGWS